MDRRPRVLVVARTRYRLPLDPPLARKFEALSDRLELRVLASAPAGAPRRDGTFRLAGPVRPGPLDGPLYYARLPLRVARELLRFQPDAIVADGPPKALAALVARALLRRRTPVVLELHGDWHADTRLYGSRLRRLLAPLADRLCASALRRADAVRTLSPATTRLAREHGVEPAAAFPAYVDLETFLATPPRPLPDPVQALFVGVLERYKNVDGLVRAWRAAAHALPGVSLRIVGDGRLRGLVEDLVAELPEQAEWTPSLDAAGIAGALDESSILVLPSRSEGLPRAALEALCRGRPVLAARVGGIPDMIDDGVNGFLVPPDDPDALLVTLVRVLRSPDALEPLAADARVTARPWLQTPEVFADRVLALVLRACGRPAPLGEPERLLAEEPVALD